MPSKFIDKAEETEEEKIMGKAEEVAPVKKKNKVKSFDGITADTVFEFHNLDTEQKILYPWSQFRHIISKDELRKIIENPKTVITKQDEYTFKMV